ncbi:hypothetical protein [Bacillus sp. J33]|uniref:hypothetical protein n=1 Tax=Bacillus sp. J33 TaxID=935836 RepID=UPI0004B5844B|nr:hypothetical protein [Bacillus sp. J33]
MNPGLWLLFGNAIATTVISAGIVVWILKKEYLPTIKKLEEEKDASPANPIHESITKEV